MIGENSLNSFKSDFLILETKKNEKNQNFLNTCALIINEDSQKTQNFNNKSLLRQDLTRAFDLIFSEMYQKQVDLHPITKEEVYRKIDACAMDPSADQTVEKIVQLINEYNGFSKENLDHRMHMPSQESQYISFLCNDLNIYIQLHFPEKEGFTSNIGKELQFVDRCIVDKENIPLSRKNVYSSLSPDELATLYCIFTVLETESDGFKKTSFLRLLEDHISDLSISELETASAIYRSLDQKIKNDLPMKNLVQIYLNSLKTKIMISAPDRNPIDVLPNVLVKHLLSPYILPSKFPRYITKNRLEQHARLLRNFSMTNKKYHALAKDVFQNLVRLQEFIKNNPSLILLNDLDSVIFKKHKIIVINNSDKFQFKEMPIKLMRENKEVEEKFGCLEKISREIEKGEVYIHLKTENSLSITELSQMWLVFLARDAEYLRFLSSKFENYREIVKFALQNNGSALWYVSLDLKNDREIVKVAVQNQGMAIRYASDDLKKDREIVKLAVQHMGYALQFASDDLKKDREIVKLAVQTDGLSLAGASLDLRNDREIVKLAIQNEGTALWHASKELKNDREIVKLAVQKNGYALQFASDELRNDREIVKLAVQNQGKSLQYASKELRNDREIVKLAVENNQEALQYASDELQNDEAIRTIRQGR